MAKIKEKKTKAKSKTGWYELVSEKEKFKEIVHILNRYYNLNPGNGHPSLAHNFREDIVKSDIDSLRIYLKKFGSYEFLIIVEISSDSGKRMDSWIHVDGVTQERVLMKEKGNLNHPVFKITSLNDLFQSHTKEVEEGLQLKTEDNLP